MIVGIFGRRQAIAFQKMLSGEAFSELPAGSKLFYVVVVTGRFIRLEICTNQLSFSASCQCVKLSCLLWGDAWGGVQGGNHGERKWVQTDLKWSSLLWVFCPCRAGIDFSWCWATANLKWHVVSNL